MENINGILRTTCSSSRCLCTISKVKIGSVNSFFNYLKSPDFGWTSHDHTKPGGNCLFLFLRHEGKKTLLYTTQCILKHSSHFLSCSLQCNDYYIYYKNITIPYIIWSNKTLHTVTKIISSYISQYLHWRGSLPM